MPNIPAAQSGAYETGSTWVGGVVPGPGDVAYANTFTVTISSSRTAQAISNASATGITAGGSFSLLDGCDLTLTNANGVLIGNTPAITTVGLGVGSSASVAANVTTANYVFIHAGNGTLNWTGNLSGSTNTVLFIIASTGTVNITGNLTNTATNIRGVDFTAAGTLNITGNLTGFIFASGSIVAGATINITGSVVAGLINANSISSGANCTVNGLCQSSSTQPAFVAGGISQNLRLSGPLLLGASGNINPIQAASWRWAPTLTPTYMEVPTSDGSTKRNLYTADNMPSGGYPIVGNVRQATVYGPSNEFTGTLVVPSPSSVALNVATDNTTGTAVLTAAAVEAAVWGATTRTLTSGGGSAPTAADVAVAVWGSTTRTLSAIEKTGYSLTTEERQAIAVAVEQSILNESDGRAILNAIVGAIGNTNIDQVALIAAIRADIERSGGMLSGKSSVDQVAAIVQEATSA